MIQVPLPPSPPVAPLPPLHSGFGPTDLAGLIFAATTVIAFFVFTWLGVRVIFRSAVGEAIAERIREGTRRRRDRHEAGADTSRMAALEERVTSLSGEVVELAERLDFAERLLAERRERKLGA